MAVQVVPIRVGEVDLLVQTVSVAGTEPTSGLGKVGERIVDAFDTARAAIVEVAASTAEVVETLGRRARRPEKLEVEFGLSFTAKGNVIVAGGEAGAALRVKVSYDAQRGIDDAPPHGAGDDGPQHRDVDTRHGAGDDARRDA